MRSAINVLSAVAFIASASASPVAPPRELMHLRRDMNSTATDATADIPNTPTPAFADEPTSTLIFESPVIVTVPSGPAAAPGFGCPAMVCKDYKNECGKRYGGCYDMCEGNVSYEDPGCPPESEIITPSSVA